MVHKQSFSKTTTRQMRRQSRAHRNLFAVWTIRLGEDGNFVLVNVLLNDWSHITRVSDGRHYSPRPAQ